jgi:D-alanyl-D-alanine carboxypeptidase/D-alanyl-D-alanine-endopeptidase (penicillin-binding protein 4)
MAEHMLVAIGQGDHLAGLEAVRTWLAQQQNDPSLFYDDGSGLSRSNGISPGLLTLYLSRFSQEPWAKAWMAGMPVSGESGTLINFSGSALKSKFQGKSGNLTQVKTYAGFLKAKSGRTLAVAVFVNRIPTSAPSLNSILLKTLEEIQRQY